MCEDLINATYMINYFVKHDNYVTFRFIALLENTSSYYIINYISFANVTQSRSSKC